MCYLSNECSCPAGKNQTVVTHSECKYSFNDALAERARKCYLKEIQSSRSGLVTVTRDLTCWFVSVDADTLRQVVIGLPPCERERAARYQFEINHSDPMLSCQRQRARKNYGETS